MSIVRWQPFREVISAQERFNQLFNQALGNVLGSEGEEALSSRVWSPAVDVYETEQSLVIKAELPGLDPKDVDVRVENQTLYIKGERRFEKDVKEGSYHRVERSYGAFARSFGLPGTVDPDKVTAEFQNGVLTLTMAKREEAKPKAIKIQVSGSESHPKSAAASSGK
ncbi:MAG TPA: Hsp20/alpha crystallin family protein [Terriglobia bacterium]|nr:Hsp20/alpha crystallin family protein [Terriglobia bacterium]